MRFNFSLGAVAIVLLSALPAFCQNAKPPGSYITGGTLSKSAQLQPAGMGMEQSRLGLPPTPMGAFVGTPSGSIGIIGPATKSGAVSGSTITCGAAAVDNGLPGVQMGVTVGTPGHGIRSDLGNKPARHARPSYNRAVTSAPKLRKKSRPAVMQEYGSYTRDAYGEPMERKW